MQNRLKNLLLLLFFASGVSALVYEVVWVRWLTLLTGTTQRAVSVVLAIFFSGLALGAFFAGKLSKRIKKPVLFYGLIEVLVGVWALVSPLFIVFLKSLAASQTNLLLGVSFFLLPPTIVLGATFPILVKALGKKNVPFLYGVNTLGAVAGVLLAGFFFPPILGLSLTVRLAGGLSLAVGLLAVYLGRKFVISAFREKTPVQAVHRSLGIDHRSLIFFVLFLGGFAALALEVLWTKLLVLVMGGSVYTFSTVLVVYLVGIALGSLFVGKLSIKRPAWVFFLSQAVVGIGVIVALFFIDRLPFLLLDVLEKASSNFWLLTTIEAGIAGTIIFVPTFFMGVSFPLAISLLRGTGERDAGYAYGVNTFGGVLGSIAAGFFLIPFLGLQRSVLMMGLVYLALAVVVLLKFIGIRRGFLLALFVVALLGVLAPSWSKEVLTSGVYSHASFWIDNKQGSEIVFYKEGLYGTVTVRKFPDGVQLLQINGKNEASSDFDSDASVFLGHLPFVVHPNAKRALLIGLGGGFTLDSMTDYDVESIDLVEIEPAVVEATRIMGEVNGESIEDKRVNIIVDDGRRYLVSTIDKYDIIVSQPSNPWLTGVSNLFTREYYELARDRLSEGGIMASWVQLYSMPQEDLKIALRTFYEVFPNVQAWTNLAGDDLILIGSSGEIAQATFKPALKKLEIDSREELLGYLLLREEEFKSLVSETKSIHSDNLPVLEFSGPKTLYQNTSEENLRLLEQARSARADKWGGFRNLLLGAQIAQFEGNLATSERLYKEALALDPQNRQVARLLADVMIVRAKGLAKEGKTDEALALYEEVKTIYSEGFVAYREKGELFLSQAKSGEAFSLATVRDAERELLGAVKLAEYDAATHISLGIIAGIYGDYERAEVELLRAIEINPRDTLAWNNLAKAYWDQGKKEEAKSAWRESLKINPNQPEIRKAIRK